MACVSAIAFATILAVVSGIMISSASAIAHDIFSNLVFAGRAQDRKQVRVAKIATVVFGLLAIALALVVKSFNVAFLVGLAFAIAASANLPVILYSLYWRRFNSAGALACVLVGIVSTVGLVLVGPAVMGPKGLIFLTTTPWFGLANPGIVSIPCGFLAGWIATVATSANRSAKRQSTDTPMDTGFDEQQLRMLSGYGAESASRH